MVEPEGSIFELTIVELEVVEFEDVGEVGFDTKDDDRGEVPHKPQEELAAIL